MSGPTLHRLLRTELQLILRERLTWVILAALAAALFIAARTGAERVAAERAGLALAEANGARVVREAKAAYARYDRPAPIKVEYWQDPTNAFGYMSYFLVAYAVKPPTPLAVLAAGQSDVQPAVMRVSFAFGTVFEDTAYEPGSAAKLSLGAIDLAFVLVYLVPLAVIALAGTRLAAEHDSGVLRMIASQPIAPRRVAGAKFGAVALVATVGVLAGMTIALLATGGLSEFDAWVGTTFLIAGALAAYVSLWVAACAYVTSLWRGGVTTLVVLVLAWTSVTIALPAVLGLAVDALAPPPSRIAAIDASRQAQTRFYAGAESARAATAWLAAKLPEAADRPDLPVLPEIKRLTRDAYYDAAVAGHRDAALAQAAAAATWSWRLALLSPATGLALALNTAAGTDAARHADFLASAVAYRRHLRAFFEPRILAQVLRPHPVCEGCPARLDFADYDAVPAFALTDPREAATRQAWLTLCSLLVGNVLLVALANRRLAAWPA